MDFIRAAALSEGGKPIFAIASRSAKGHPRIVSSLKQGAGVVTTRAHVHHVVTEFGNVNLFGKTLNERAKALISISHPDDRETLDRQWFEIKQKLTQ
jgi:acyl-CoA hydrolase